jgi:mannose-6-phosphate isomerase-like protein (cupin superfamily)
VLVAWVTAIGGFTTGVAQSRIGVGWNLRVSEAKGPVRAADVSTPLGGEVSSEILAGPANGSESGYLIFTRMPAGSRGPALFTLPDNHLLMVLEGNLGVQIGTDTFAVDPHTAVVIPAGIPHHVWNAGNAEVRLFEVVAPGSSRELATMLTAAQPRKIENAAQYIRRNPPPPQAEMKPGLNARRYASRDQGTAQQMRIDSTLPGSGGPPTHIHKFEQVYFSIDGQTTLTHGLFTYPLPKYSVGVIAPGVVHTNNNDTNAIERHVTLLLDELADKSEPLDVEVEIKRDGAQ